MPTSTEKDPRPDQVAPWILEMQQESKLAGALMEGTKGMQAKGTTYLPQHPNEDDGAYEFRLASTRLRNFYRRTVKNTVGKLFSSPFTVEDESKPITNIIKNIDRSGMDVQAFTRDLMKDALCNSGVSFFLVDRSRNPASNAQQEQTGQNAPYWVNIALENLIDIQYTKDPDITVTHLRFFQTSQRVVDRFETEEVLQIKVIEPDRWEVWERQKSNNGSTKKETWTIVSEGVNTLGIVALVPLYLDRTGPFKGEGPLADLADMNLEHWQLRSEQRRTIQINSFPILGVFNTEASTEELVVGPASILKINGDNAKAEFLEPSGGSMDTARDEIKDLEEQMRAFGAQFEVAQEQSSMETASGRVIDAKEANSTLHLWALSLKDSVEMGLMYTTMWLSVNESAAGTVRMNMAFDGGVFTDAQVERLMKLRQLGDLSRPGLLKLMKKSGDLPEDFDIEEDSDLIEEDDPDDLIPPSGNPASEEGLGDDD